MLPLPACPRTRLLLDPAWKFHLGDVPVAPVQGHMATYMACKAGEALGAARPTYDDTAWPTVDLPHDWQVANAFDSRANLDHGYKARGVAWYRRRFRLDASAASLRHTLEFDGVATHCTVWVNGLLLHREHCGYTPFTVDFTDVALFGARPNTVVVRVDATPFEGWWYEGAGIYRHVYLVQSAPLHIARDGVWVNPVLGAADQWSTQVEVTVANTAFAAADAEVAVTVHDPSGAAVGHATGRGRVAARSSTALTLAVPVAAPLRWSLAQRHLYTLRTELRQGGATVDAADARYGYRTLRYDPNHGFFLNDEHVLLKGTCNHQDHAGVGVALPDALHTYRIQRLLDMGSNAYRCAHNPPAPELLAACDELGMLVMDENRHFNSSPEVMDQLARLVRRDRNHPSVIMWSIFNEEPWQGTATGRRLATTMAHLVRQLDPARPVTAAMNGGVLDDDGVANVVDLMGINYCLNTYDAFHAKHPALPMFASETHCAFMTRDEHVTSKDARVFDSYDESAAPWGTTWRAAWRAVVTRPYLAGLFAWTGFDYRGEPSPYEWPCVNSHWGILDTCGFPKAAYYLQQAYWLSTPVLHLVPHWNWPGKEGQLVRVLAISNAESVELCLNGTSLGRKASDPIDMVDWQVPYAPGVLEAVAYRGGQEIARHRVETTGPAVALRLSPARPALQADGEDALSITVAAVDAQGRVVPTAALKVAFTLRGPGRLLGVGNGDPNCQEPDKAFARSLFHGLCATIVGAADAPGALEISAVGEGLPAVTLALPCVPAPRRPRAAVVCPELLLSAWRLSPVTTDRPDPSAVSQACDVNTWEAIEVYQGPQGAFAAAAGYAVYRTTLTLPEGKRGGTLEFAAVLGRAEVFVNGVARATKPEPAEGPLCVTLPTDLTGAATIAVLLHGGPPAAGLTQPVRWLPGAV